MQLQKHPKPSNLSKALSVDICFMIDGTGSMSSIIQEAKNNLNSIQEELFNNLYRKGTIRIDVICYRDYCDVRSS